MIHRIHFEESDRMSRLVLRIVDDENGTIYEEWCLE